MKLPKSGLWLMVGALRDLPLRKSRMGSKPSPFRIGARVESLQRTFGTNHSIRHRPTYERQTKKVDKLPYLARRFSPRFLKDTGPEIAVSVPRLHGWLQLGSRQRRPSYLFWLQQPRTLPGFGVRAEVSRPQVLSSKALWRFAVSLGIANRTDKPRYWYQSERPR